MRLFSIVVATLWIGAIAFGLPTFAQESREVGLDRSNLTWEPREIEQSTLQGIQALGAGWFRDVLSGQSPRTNQAFVEELRLAKADHLKFLANVLPWRSDFDDDYKAPNAGPEFAKRCGWPQGSGEFSKIKLDRLDARLRAQLDAVKAAGLTIDAFEIGNETDWICFNGDVPDGHIASPEELLRLVRGYASFLKASATVIHDKAYFPDSPIVTFGVANISDDWDKGHHIPHPERILTMLTNLDGFNFLDNDIYHVAGVGVHLYPPPDHVSDFVVPLIAMESRAAGGKPVWITEWGFNAHLFDNRNDVTRVQAIGHFYRAIDAAKTPLGPSFYYAYSVRGDLAGGLVDSLGRPLPEASAVTLRARQP